MNKFSRPYEGCVAALLFSGVTGCVSVESAPVAERLFEPEESAESLASDLGIEVPAADVASERATRVDVPPAAEEASEFSEASEFPEFRELDDPVEAAFPRDEEDEDQESRASTLNDEAPPSLDAQEEAALQRIRTESVPGDDLDGEGDSDWYEVDPSSLVGGDGEADADDTSAAVSPESGDTQLAVLEELINAPLGNVADQLGANAMLADADLDMDVGLDFEGEAAADELFEADGEDAVQVAVAAVVPVEVAPATSPSFQLRGRVVTSPGAVGRFAVGPRTIVVRSYS